MGRGQEFYTRTKESKDYLALTASDMSAIIYNLTEDMLCKMEAMEAAVNGIAPWVSAALSTPHCSEYAAAANALLELVNEQ